MLGLIDQFQRDRDSQPFQGIGIEIGNRLVDARPQHDLESKGLARVVAQHPVRADLPAGPGQFPAGGAQIASVAHIPPGRGQLIALDRPGQQLVAKGRKQGQDLAAGGTRAHAQLGIAEIAQGPRCAPLVDHLVDEFEIEGAYQRIAHPPVGKDGATRVEHESPHPRRAPVGNDGFHDIAALHGGEIVLILPSLGAGFAIDRQFAALEGLEKGGGIAKIFIADFVEIVLAPIDGQVAPPVIGVATE